MRFGSRCLVCLFVLTLLAPVGLADEAGTRARALVKKHGSFKSSWLHTNYLGVYSGGQLVGYQSYVVSRATVSGKPVYQIDLRGLQSISGAVSKTTGRLRVRGDLSLLSSETAMQAFVSGRPYATVRITIQPSSGSLIWKYEQSGQPTRSQRVGGRPISSQALGMLPMLMLSMKAGQAHRFDVLTESTGKMASVSYTRSSAEDRQVAGSSRRVCPLRSSGSAGTTVAYQDARSGQVVEQTTSVQGATIAMRLVEWSLLSKRFGKDAPPKPTKQSPADPKVIAARLGGKAGPTAGGGSPKPSAAEKAELRRQRARSAVAVVAELYAAIVRKDRKALLSCVDLREMVFDEMYSGKGSAAQRRTFGSIWKTQSAQLTDRFVKDLLAVKLPAGSPGDAATWKRYCKLKSKGGRTVVQVKSGQTSDSYYMSRRTGPWLIVGLRR